MVHCSIALCLLLVRAFCCNRRDPDTFPKKVRAIIEERLHRPLIYRGDMVLVIAPRSNAVWRIGKCQMAVGWTCKIYFTDLNLEVLYGTEGEIRGTPSDALPIVCIDNHLPLFSLRRGRRYLRNGHAKEHGSIRCRLQQLQLGPNHGEDGDFVSNTTHAEVAHQISVKGAKLEVVDNFSYLDSTLSRASNINDEVARQISTCGRFAATDEIQTLFQKKYEQ
ncbi:hypothetical protein SprV_0501967700 [Sparganum proliferum]